MEKFYFSTVLFLLFSINVLQGQSTDEKQQKPNNWSLQIKYGIPLFDKGVPTFSTFETTTQLYPTYHTTLGIGYQYYFSKKMSLKASVAYELGSHLKAEENSYTDFLGLFRKSKATDHYLNHSLLLPVQFYYQMNRTSISVGLLSSIRLSTKVGVRKKFWINEALVEELEKVYYKDGDRLIFGTVPLIDRTNVDLEKKIDFQILFALQYRLNQKWALDLEVRQPLTNNRLRREVFNYDAGGSIIQHFAPYPRMLTFGLSYFLSQRT